MPRFTVLMPFALLLTALLAVGCKPPAPKVRKAETPAAAKANAEEAKPAVVTDGKATGTPNPPFIGELPPVPLVWKREGATPGHYGGNLILPSQGNPKHFNPVMANDKGTSDVIQGPIYQTVADFDPITFDHRPLLATSWDTSEDGLTYTFHLRKGVRWSDGHPFTADDVIFNLDVIFHPDTPSSTKDLFKDSKGGFPAYAKVDDHTIRLTLTEVNVLFVPTMGSVYLIPKHKWEESFKAGKISQILLLDAKPEDVVTLGPYRLRSFSSDQRVVLERNPYYWAVDQWGNRLPYLDKLTFLVVPDFNTSMLKFLGGELNIYDEVRPDQYDLIKRDEAKGDFKVHDLGATLTVNYLSFNLNTDSNQAGKPYVKPHLQRIFNDVRFRRAMSHAIDREGIIKTALLGRGRPQYCMTSPANKTWFHDCTRYEHDPAKAKALLDEMGLVDRDGDGIREDTDGNKVSFEIRTNVENNVRIATGNVLKTDLTAVGVDASLRPIPFNNLITSSNATFDWEAMILGWASGVPPDPAMSKNIYLSSGRTHIWHPKQKTPGREWEKEVDSLVATLTGTLDMKARKATHDKILEIFARQQAQIFTVNENKYVAGRNNVGNFYPTIIRPYGHWNLLELFLKPKKG